MLEWVDFTIAEGIDLVGKGIKPLFVGVDLFAGAGGMSLGARMAGVEVQFAVEKDPHAAATYSLNHPGTTLVVGDVADVRHIEVAARGKRTVLFGGPPCQGFSTSNQRTRGKNNPGNWLYEEFLRVLRMLRPDWVVFENVRGIIETEKGFFRDKVLESLEDAGYTCTSCLLCASQFGVPQVRSRFFLVGSRHEKRIEMPRPHPCAPVTVRQAISDLPKLRNGAAEDYLPYPGKARSNYAKRMRNGQCGCRNHLVTLNAPQILKRYKHIPQGGNWEDIPPRLMTNYADRTRCHTGIYHRLREDQPSVVLGNYRKNMLVHPWEDRGLSVREAARLQSFPDWYEFVGSIGFKQQQVANAVPPLLAAAVFGALVETE